MNKLLSMLSKMDKKDLEAGIARAQQILKTKEGEKLINNFKQQNNGNH